MKLRLGRFEYLYCFLVFLDLWAMYLYPGLRLLTKPLIVSSLLVHYIMVAGDFQRPVILTALIFALMGDIFLMFDYPMFFQMGLGSFLVMQLCYTSVFKSLGVKTDHYRWLGMSAVLLVAIVFNWVYRAQFGALQWPVALYTLAIVAMVITAIRQKENPWLIWGAVLFMISDLSLAFHKFVAPIPHEGILIMSTYAAAQYLIIKGLLAVTLPRR